MNSVMTSDTEKFGETASIRDTVESIWIAIVLAFVLRAFIIEAFVIPTGSMAPRLMGDHRDLLCPSCKMRYAFGMPQERPGHHLNRGKKHSVVGARCPNCGFPYSFRTGPDSGDRKAYINSGDRVLVLKYPYRFYGPEPWDIVVFKNPQSNRENYIKRLIGLPGETIEIVHGDIFVKKSDDAPWRIRRKPPEAQEAMWQVIYDNDYLPDMEMIEKANSLILDDSKKIKPPQWKIGSSGWLKERQFKFKGGERPVELAFVPGPRSFLPTYGYNIWAADEKNNDADGFNDICSDLRLAVMFIPKGPNARVTLKLSSMENQFEGRVGADGSLELSGRSSDGSLNAWDVSGKVAPFKLNDGCDIALVHVDFRVELWVNGKVVLASTDEHYPADHQAREYRLKKRGRIPPPKVGITAEGDPLELWHIKLHRDVYYTCPQLAAVLPGPRGDFARSQGIRGEKRRPGWGTTGKPIKLRDRPGKDMDEFFALGDNSPQSLDGRGWTSAAPTLRLYDENIGERLYQLGTTPRYLLIGKALFVYWPSGFRLPGLPGLPIIPNVGRMRMIR